MTSEKPVDERVMGSSREVCWQARDAYFACLDRNDIQLPSTRQQLSNDTESANAMATQVRRHCRDERARLEEQCLVSWIRHFEQRRAFEREKSARMDALNKRDASESKSLNQNQRK